MRTNILETVKVNSTAINEVKYDIENNNLEVEFVNQSKYVYRNVCSHKFLFNSSFSFFNSLLILRCIVLDVQPK